MKDLKVIDEIEKPEVRVLKEVITDLCLSGFSGRLEVNFQYGGIASAHKYEKINLKRK